MTSINDSLSPDLLFNIFKRLDCIETTKVRRVCKEWFEIIDEHKSFWRTLHLPKDSLEKWDPSILELYDRKSESTLEDVEIGVKVEMELQTQFFDILERSKATLKHLFLKSELSYFPDKQDPFHTLSAVESLRVLGWHHLCRVRLRRTSVKRDSQDDGSNTASPLRVLWYGANRSVLQNNSARLKNLVSLDTTVALSSSEWRDLLEGPSGSLKHLTFSFKHGYKENHSGVPTLEFPKLEVLELDDGGNFPRWLLIPDSAILIAHSGLSNLPSISELWAEDLDFMEEELSDRCARLKTLVLVARFQEAYQRDPLLNILNKRRINVEAGLEVDGVKMEPIQKLVLPSKLGYYSDSKEAKSFLERCRGLVEVVEGDAQSWFIDIEV